MSSHPHKPPGPARATPPQGHGETILLAEDQKLMQVVTTRLLTALGYRVMVAGSVKEAVLLWLDQEGEIDLLLTDYTFHGTLTGMDLIVKLRKRAPDLPALIVSGSWAPDPRKKPWLPPNVAYLAKPYEMVYLAETVRQLLDGRPPKSKPKPHPRAR